MLDHDFAQEEMMARWAAEMNQMFAETKQRFIRRQRWPLAIMWLGVAFQIGWAFYAVMSTPACRMIGGGG